MNKAPKHRGKFKKIDKITLFVQVDVVHWSILQDKM